MRVCESLQLSCASSATDSPHRDCGLQTESAGVVKRKSSAPDLNMAGMAINEGGPRPKTAPKRGPGALSLQCLSAPRAPPKQWLPTTTSKAGVVLTAPCVEQARRRANRAACGASTARRIRRHSGVAAPTARAPSAMPAGCEVLLTCPSQSLWRYSADHCCHCVCKAAPRQPSRELKFSLLCSWPTHWAMRVSVMPGALEQGQARGQRAANANVAQFRIRCHALTTQSQRWPRPGRHHLVVVASLRKRSLRTRAL